MAGRGPDALALASFVALGLPDGMIGAAWPSMRQDLHAPVGDLGLVLLAATAGSVLVTLFVGRIFARGGVAPLLAVGLGCAAGAAAGFALVPGFAVIVSVALLFGVAAGMMDGGLNTAVGLSGRRRLLNLLHGAYGIGTAIGPLVVTAAILAGSWRPAYLVLLATDAGLAALWARQWRRTGPARAGPAARTAAPGPPASAGRRAAVLAGIAVFFVYTGLEVAAGQWEATFGRTRLHLSAAQAGLATAGYWAALTAVRICLALLPRPLPSETVIRWGTGIALLATGLIWWQPGSAATVTGFAVLGAALAGIFPALIALTPARLGEQRAKNVIAWQVGAAACGGAGISALLGLFIDTTGLGVLGPALVALAVILATAELLLGRLAPATAWPAR